MRQIHNIIRGSFEKFPVNLKGRVVLTEAASGNYVCTPVLAALAGAEVYAITRDSQYGSAEEVTGEVYDVAGRLGVDKRIRIVTGLEEVPLRNVDIVTNTGFVRPINKYLIDRLKRGCVIPLMWEPWEFRAEELDLDYAVEKGIKVYGTDESAPLLRTFDYLGFICVYFLLKEKRSPAGTKVALIGCSKFTTAINEVLNSMKYNTAVSDTTGRGTADLKGADAIIVAEHINNRLIIGNTEDSLIKAGSLGRDHLVIHICGNIDTSSIHCKIYPEKPASFGYMSYTADFIDPVAVTDLHAAGLRVAGAMLTAGEMGLTGINYKSFVESFGGLAFDNEKYW